MLFWLPRGPNYGQSAVNVLIINDPEFRPTFCGGKVTTRRAQEGRSHLARDALELQDIPKVLQLERMRSGVDLGHLLPPATRRIGGA
jgi:hypothetical protein